MACHIAGVMASRDAGIAQITMEALWHSICDSAEEDSKGRQGHILEGLRSALRHCFEQQPRQSGYVGCLQSFALADRGGSVSVKRAAEAAQASGRLQAGALQVQSLPHPTYPTLAATRCLTACTCHALSECIPLLASRVAGEGGARR